jgi:hypothetical protein
MRKDEQAALLCRVGWCVNYDGLEQPIGGGRYNDVYPGGEQANFVPHDGQVYGYVSPPLTERLNFSRIAPSSEDGMADDVLVVWVATHPEEGGQRVIGWYRHATAHEQLQKPPSPRQRHWYFRADTASAVLIPADQRSFRLSPTRAGGMGQSNVRYLYDQSGEWQPPRWWRGVVNYIENYEGENLIGNPYANVVALIGDVLETRAAGGQGFGLTPKERKAVEDHAMARAKAYYRKLGWTKVDDVSKNRPHDLLCTKGRGKLCVEVKGTTGPGDSVVLTRNEVKHAKENRSALVIVSGISLSGSKTNPKASGGRIRVEDPFNPEDKRLNAIAYDYQPIV